MVKKGAIAFPIVYTSPFLNSLLQYPLQNLYSFVVQNKI